MHVQNVMHMQNLMHMQILDFTMHMQNTWIFADAILYRWTCAKLNRKILKVSGSKVDQPRTILEKLKYEVGKGLRF